MKKAYLLGAALALAMVPALPAAAEEGCPPSSSVGSGASSSASDLPRVDEGVGGSAESDAYGTDSAEVREREDMEGNERDEEAGTGGTGTMTREGDQTVVVVPSESDREAQRKGRETKASNEGLAVTAQGGVEGYTGALAPRIAPGAGWGVTVSAQPTRVVGLELGYTGAVNNIDDPAAADSRIVRNGGNINLKIALAPTAVEPYVFGGVGISRANVNNEAGGYQDDTFGQIPLGAGLNFNIGAFQAGARVSYDVLFNRDFAPETETNSFGINDKPSGDLWRGTLQLGTKF